jgi:hypothetical protein
MLRNDLLQPPCPYCEQPGGTVSWGDHYLHQSCYLALQAELAQLDQTPTTVQGTHPRSHTGGGLAVVGD